MKKALSLLVVSFALLAGCTSLGELKEKPRVSIAGVEVIDGGFFEQRYRLQLRVQNPNPVDLPIRAVDYQVELNGKPFATGLSNRGITVPRYGTSLLIVDGTSNLGALLRQLKDFDFLREQSLPYLIRGTLRVTEHDISVPFEHRGEVPFGLGQKYF